jgi:hypothetical protein
VFLLKDERGLIFLIAYSLVQITNWYSAEDVFWNSALRILVDTDRYDQDDHPMMKATGYSETLVSIYQTTWCNIPEDSCLQIGHCENLKSQQVLHYSRNSILL